MLAVFDFDHTIVDHNSDIIARDIINPSNLIPNHKDYPGNWTEYMQQVFNTLKHINISVKQIIDVISMMNSIEGIPYLLRTLYENNIDIIIASDSNSLFINNWLKHNELSDVVSCVYTNPAKIENDCITIEPYTLQQTCNRCSKNMCKGNIIREHKLSKNKKYDKILYFGDGNNDLCPILKLTQNDFAFPRLGYVLENLLKSHNTQAKVMPWRTGDDIYKFLKSSKLISA